MAMARDSRRSARRRSRRLGVCQGWLPHVGIAGGVGCHDVRRREGRGRGPPPAWRRGLRPRHDSMNPAVARMPHFQAGLPENTGSERGARASHPTPGWPLGDREVCQGRAGFPTPHRPQRRRSVANIVRRRHEAWSISRNSFLSCDSFLLESRSPGPDAPAGRRWRRLLGCPSRTAGLHRSWRCTDGPAPDQGEKAPKRSGEVQQENSYRGRRTVQGDKEGNGLFARAFEGDEGRRSDGGLQPESDGVFTPAPTECSSQSCCRRGDNIGQQSRGTPCSGRTSIRARTPRAV